MRKHFIGVLFFTVITATFASSTDINTIIDKLEANTVYDTVVTESTMTTTDQFGITVNSFKSWNRRNGDTLIEIKDGPDRGQKILRKDSSIFLFYPDAEEVIRLQGSALKDSLMGSDFSYEDLTGDDSFKNRFDSVLVDKQTIDGHQCYHILMTAKKQNETYRKQELWVDTNLFVSIKTILYSASGRALRELHSSEIKNINGYNVATKLVMKDLLKKDSETVLLLDHILIDNPIEDKIFSRENLTW